MESLGSTMRIVRPAPAVIAFYDGRVEGRRVWSDEKNWLDDGAYSLGVCSYAIIDGSEALVFDTHISLQHARIIRKTLSEMGVVLMRVVLSHWHDDHVAGNEIFQDCEIIAHELTLKALTENKASLESGNPPIKPLIVPTRTYDDTLELMVGSIPVEVRHVDIHSSDGTVLCLPNAGLLFAGDALEDPITYVSEPNRLGYHLEDLKRMQAWEVRRILPNHGALATIENGGYGAELIHATRLYVEKLLRCAAEPELITQDLRTFVADAFASGSISYFAPYEEVHQSNVQAVCSAHSPAPLS